MWSKNCKEHCDNLSQSTSEDKSLPKCHLLYTEK